MPLIKSKAMKLIGNSTYPEIVQCEFYDYAGYLHTFIEKWPVVSSEQFDNVFPTECFIGCVIVEERQNTFIVNTEEPWDICSEDENYIFEISKDLLIR